MLLFLVADVLRAREELDGLRHCKSRPFNPLTIIQVKNAERNVDNSENDTWWRSSNVLWNTTGCFHLWNLRHEPYSQCADEKSNKSVEDST